MKRMLLFLMLLSLVLSAAACAEETHFEFSSQGGAAAETGGGGETPWSYPVSREILDDPLGLIVLANKENLLEKGYPSESVLVKVNARKASSSDMKARDVAEEALERMFDAAEAEGVMLYVSSAYRSFRTQEVMHYNRVESMGYDDGVVQAAGASDHQTGMGFDVVSKAWIGSKFNVKFAQTQEAQWMAAHGPEYGFIIRYPDGKEDVTGIMFEPWHLRYVGVEVAQYMTAQGITLEEFTLEYRRAIELFDAGQAWESEPAAQTPANADPLVVYEQETDAFSF